MANGKPCILIVEDDENIRETLRAILTHEGYRTDTAKNGQDAIRKSQSTVYNLALLDIKLPDMEGTKLLTDLRETTPRMVKIMLTGYPSLENAVESLNRGANAYLIKPVNPDRLLALVAEKLDEQLQTDTMTRDKVTEWVKTRVSQLDQENDNSLRS
jgi:DNA-binding NtrC family response regulator